jgi:tetratricopeptide (TPR) repeat protein
MLLQTRSSLLVLAVGLGLSATTCKAPVDRSAGASDGTAGGAEEGGEGARVVKIRGPKGLTAAGLPEGAYLGEGAALAAGQVVEVPIGTQAELETASGAIVRVNEGASLSIDGARRISLGRGEIVVRVDAAPDRGPVEVAAAEELLLVHAGEAQVRHTGERRHYAVVFGSAELRTGDDTVELGPGATIDIPWEPGAGAPPDQDPRPLVSLQPLEDAAWAASFDAAARMAEAVPRGIGSLSARRAGSSTRHESLRLVDQKVMVSISGRIAHTEIEQAFYNESGETMEGIYRFPLPADASISGLSLLVGDRWMDGEMVEKERGQRIFQQIVDATVPRDPALLHWEQGNVFKLRIFPIPGRGERRIRLSYTQVLPTVGEALRYRYPMGGSGSTEAAIDQFELAIRIDRADLDEEQIDGISTPMMRMSARETEGVVELAARERDYLPTADLGVDIPLRPDQRRIDSEAHLDRDGQAYFMTSFRPELALEASDRPAHWTFVLDRSHSTTPELWTLARGIVGAMVAEMAPDDRISVLACDTACEVSHAGPVHPTGTSVDEVEAFLDAQVLGGASDLGAMFEAAADRLGRDAGATEGVVVYLGDGVPTSGPLAVDELANDAARSLGGARLEAVALGARSDLSALQAIIDRTGGDVLRADPRDERERLVRELTLRARVPVVRDVELELPPGMFDVHPRRIASLRPGQEVTLVGRIDRPVVGDVRLTAAGPQGRIDERFPVMLRAEAGGPARHAHLPRTWARAEIEHLTATEGHAAMGRIVSLSRAYTVLSRFTALIVLENDRMYREFRVARNAHDTDRWQGQLAQGATAGQSGARPYASAGPVTPSATSTPAPFPDAEPTERERAAETAPAGPDGAEARLDREDVLAQAEASRDTRGKGDADDDEAAFDASALEEASEESWSGEGRAAPAPKPDKMAKKKTAGSDMALSDPWDGGGGGGGGGGYAYELGGKRKHYRRPPPPQIRAASAPSARALGEIDRLRAARDRDPLSRAKHRALVRAAIHAGHAEAMAFAQTWVEADPDESQALLSLADLLAARGDPAALRAYAGAVEVRPFARTAHERLALAYHSKGDLARSCSHRRAIVSIDPRVADHHVELARCLHAAGRTRAAEQVLTDAQGRVHAGRTALARAQTELMGSPRPAIPNLHAYPDLRAVLEWGGAADLDIALVDKRGRRLSVLRPEKIRVREEAGRETVTLPSVDGTVHVEVTRLGAAAGDPPIHATLSVRTPYGARTFPVDIDHGTLRIASISWPRGLW